MRVLLADLHAVKDEALGNARLVRNLFEKVQSRHADRVSTIEYRTFCDLTTIGPRHTRRSDSLRLTSVCYTDKHVRRFLAVLLAAPALFAQLAITNVNVIDIVTGEIRPAQTVVTDGHRIVAAGPSASIQIPPKARRIPGDGRYLIPGLWDMHVHFRNNPVDPTRRLTTQNEAMLDLFLANGIVGIREMGGDLSEDVLRWRDEIRAGYRTGPSILAPGRKIDRDPPDWPGSIGVKTPEDARQAVRQLKRDTADFIKVYFGNVPADVLRAVTEEAHRHNLKVVGHLPSNLHLAEVAASGLMDGIEHYTSLIVAPSEQAALLQKELESRRGTPLAPEPAELLGRRLWMADAKEMERTNRIMAEKNFWVTPTIAVVARVYSELGHRDFSTDPRRRYFFPEIWNSWDEKLGRRRPNSGRVHELQLQSIKRANEAFLAAHKAGVPMLVGTDCGVANNYVYPGWSLHEEMEKMIAAGLKPLEVLRLATVNAAKWRGRTEQEGSIAADKQADLVLLRANPLEDIRRTREIDGLVLRGRYLSRAELDDLLEKAAARVSASQPPR